MLAQHPITRPLLDAEFEGHLFVERNPVSRAMKGVLSVIDKSEVGREARSLEAFHVSVHRRHHDPRRSRGNVCGRRK